RVPFVWLRDVDFPVSYQSRKGKTGRHRAALSGLGSWVGARVASPHCPILRRSLLSVPRSTATVQVPPSRTWLAVGRWPSPVSAFVWPRLARPDLPACRQGRKREFRGQSSGPGGPRGLLPWGSRRSVLALSRIRLLIS